MFFIITFTYLRTDGDNTRFKWQYGVLKRHGTSLLTTPGHFGPVLLPSVRIFRENLAPSEGILTLVPLTTK